MREAELFKIMQPRAFGGYELGYDVFVEAVATIASGDGSTGWVYSLGAVHQWLIACFPMEAQHEVWDDNPDAIAAASYAPSGRAVPTPGGYRLSGRWSFASGVDNVQWGMIGGMLPGEGGSKPGFLLVPRSEFTIDDDWFTMGLAGTGSKTIVVDDVFVPAYRTALFSDLLTGQAPGSKASPNPLYRQPMLAVVPQCLLAPVLGMARGALSTFVEQISGRATRGAVAGGNNKMTEFATVQLRVAEATACIDAAQLMIARDLTETLDIVQRDQQVDVPTRMRNRLTHTFATKLLVQAVDAVFTAAGGNALGTKQPLQRFWRDIHAAGSHISLNWDAVGSMYGQHMFGLEPRGQY
ncbi:flavin-dependent monooxygenase [Pseudolabrys taiwanensis]|uniref:Flavin-dependent monooxygenase n=2 Tax=Pseudolabrys taiwanensis TaxID=331696 RepID=A0A345ZVK6_9HYPH|nr:flavin-dependent monooxygenase [Pseudolabrys taiwanensis]